MPRMTITKLPYINYQESRKLIMGREYEVEKAMMYLKNIRVFEEI